MTPSGPGLSVTPSRVFTRRAPTFAPVDQDLGALVIHDIARQAEHALAEKMRTFPEMPLQQRGGWRLEEDQAVARNRCRLVEPEGPVGQARARIDEESMVLAESGDRRPGKRQGYNPGEEQRTPDPAQRAGEKIRHGRFSRPSLAATRCSSSAVASGTSPASTASATSTTRPLLPISRTAASAAWR